MTEKPIQQLETLLQADQKALEALGQTLSDERDAIRQNDMARLERITGEKQQLLDDLRERARRKVRVLVKLGYTPEKGQASRFLEQAGVPAGLCEQWRAAQEALARCQHENSVNGRIITHLLQRVSRLSEIVRGVDGQSKLYGDSGREEALSHKSILASA